MSKQLRIWLFVLLGTIFTSTSLLAEGVITMTTSKAVGETIRLYIKANGNVTIEGAQETGQTDEYGQKDYTIESQTITIRGDVTELSCGNLYYSRSQLTSLDVSSCASLTTLDCSYNQLTSLDVSKNTALEVLYCNDNRLPSLDVSKNTALTELECNDNLLPSLDVSKNPTLTMLDCSGNRLPSLDVSKNTALTDLTCSRNQLSSLDVSQNSTLTTLDCFDNRLPSLDVSKNPTLTDLTCSRNQLPSLDVSQNPTLTKLDCSGNLLPSLDLSQNTSLTTLNCSGNRLPSLDVSQNTSLTTLNCSDNQLTSLDVSGCIALSTLKCSDNQLTSLDVSSCTALTTLDCSVNQLINLDLSTCPQLNYVDCSTNQIKGEAMRQLAASLPTCNSNHGQFGYFIVVSNSAQERNFCSKADLATVPEKNWNSFKKVREYEFVPYEGEDGNLQVGRGVITMTTTKAIGEAIPLAIKADGGVTIEGVEPFLQPDGHTAYYTLTSQALTIRGDVTELECHNNQLTSLDVSKNTALTTLGCQGNQLTSLDVSGCTALIKLDCRRNNLTSLDVSKNTALTTLDCSYNQLTSLDVSKNIALATFDCQENQLTSLGELKNRSLTSLDCRHNNLTSLDVSKNTALTKLETWGNQLTSLDVSGCTALTELDCGGYRLTSLNVSGCTALKKLDCSGPNSSYPDNRVGVLTSLDVSGCTSLTDFTCSRNQLTSLDLSSCTALTTLDCRHNNLTRLDVSKNTALTTLDCSYNQLTSLKVSGCSVLAKLDCSVNQLTSLDVSSCTALTKLDCSVNQLTSLDLSACSQLNYVDCSANQIKGSAMTQLVASLSTYNSGNEDESGKFIVVSNLAPEGNVCSKADVATAHKKNWNSLKRVRWSEFLPYEGEDDNLQVGRGVITITTTKAIGDVIALAIKADGGVAIEGVKPFLQPDGNIAYYTLTDQTVVIHGDVTGFGCYSSQLTSLDFSSCTTLTALYCSGAYLRNFGQQSSSLISLNVSGCTSLTELDCSNNQLTSLNVSGCTALTKLNCRDNRLTSLDLSSCTTLTELDCRGNQLPSLDVSSCTSLTKLNCRDNRLTSLDLSGCTSLTELDCYGNQLTSLDVSGCTALTKLDCSDPNYHNSERPGPLTSLKVNGCTSLTELYCYGNQLTSLDLSGCVALTMLNCSINRLTSLDVTGCPSLIGLGCYVNQLTSLKVNGCTSLTELYCFGNQLTSLDLSGCASLTKLFCGGNQLTSLDVSICTTLKELDCSSNQLTRLDVSSCTALTELRCGGNHLPSLNVSGCPSLNYLDCSANQIKGKAMTQLVASLPTCTSDYQDPLNQYNYSGGYFIIVSNSAQEGNFCSKADLASTREKNWTSLKSIDEKLIPYEGESDTPQEPVGRGIIKMTTTRTVGETIQLRLKANGGFVIEGAKTPLQPNEQVAHYTLTSQTIIIRGDLTELNCAGSQLASLDVSGCPSLIKISCGSPSGEKGTLTSLKASGCTALTDLDCGNNPLISLDVSGCTALTKLVFEHKYRTTLDSLNASRCTALTELNCQYIQLSSLDVSGCTALTELDCGYNQLTGLDLSGCPALTQLGCSSNNLTSLDVSKNTALTSLDCSSNQLSNLDLSGCTALTSLSCEGNQLTSLDVSGCTSLKWLVCGDLFKGKGALTSLNASGCTALTTLDCQYNQLTSLDISGCTSLTKLDCWNNQLTSLDLSGCTALTELDCGYNQLTSLDLSHSSALIELNCYGNALTSLDLAKCLNLRYVDCSRNRIKGEAMNRLVASLSTCSGDYHGQYSDRNSYSGGYFVAVSSSDYEWNICSKENVASAHAKNWTTLNKMRGFKYYNLELVPYEGVDESQLVGHGVITMTTAKAVGEPITLLFRANGGVALEGVKETLQSDGSTTYQILSGQTITLRGDVTALRCVNSKLTSLDVSGCVSLTQLHCWGNQLTNLDVSQNRALTDLQCHKNQLTSLDVSQNSVLALLSCGDNQLTNLDVSQNAALIGLYSDGNQLTNLDVSKNTALTTLGCQGNQLTSLDVSQNAALEDLYCNNNQLTSLELSQNSALRWLYCNDNQLTSLDLSQNLSLYTLYCQSNRLTSLDLSHNSDLRKLGCYYNQIKGAEMTKLVNGLPQMDRRYNSKFYVVVKDSLEGNVCLKSDVAIAADKGWTPLGYNRSTEAWEYYRGRETDSFAVSLTHEGEGVLDATGADDLKAVPYGTKLTITATPAEGYELAALTANGFDILESKSFEVTGYTEIKATFRKKTFAISLAESAHGAIAIAESVDLQAVPYGTTLTITAIPETGYELTALTANGKDILEAKSFVVKGATEIRATFSIKHFAVTLTQEGEGKVDVVGAEELTSVPYGTKLSIKAMPKQGYELVALTANGEDILTTKHFVVKSDIEVKVTFAKKTFAVTLAKDGEGTLNATGADDLNAVPYGTKLTITATPAEGYELKALMANGLDILSTKSVEVTGDTRIKAIFEKQTFAVTLTSNEHGTLSVNELVDLQAVLYGTTLTISAIPETGYELTALTANGENILEAKNFVVKGATEICATFSIKHFAVTLTQEGEGKVEVIGVEELTSVPYGTELSIKATPKQGYNLVALTANGEDILSTKHFVVKSDTEVKVTFAKKTFAVTLAKDGEGTLNAIGADDLNAVPYGTKLTITATPADGYELKALMADGLDILPTKSVEVTGDTRIVAIFKKKTFAVSLTKDGEGTLSVKELVDLQAVPYSTELTIVATPAEGYELTALTANGTDILATKKVVVTNNVTIKATFEKKTFAVKLTSNEHGEITIAEQVDLDAVPYGTTLTVKATGKNAQCVLTELTANGKDILATQSFVVTDVTEIKATFVDHTGVETTVTQLVKLYPNPATDYIVVAGVAPASEVTLHSMTGERLYAGRADDRGTLQIDLTPYADGVYLVCVAGDTYRVVVRK